LPKPLRRPWRRETLEEAHCSLERRNTGSEGAGHRNASSRQPAPEAVPMAPEEQPRRHGPWSAIDHRD
jgi:hypothetical protein